MKIIRQLEREDDLADLISLSRAFFAEYETHHDEFFDIDQLEDAHISDYFARTIDSASDATFVAMVDQRMVGYITVHVRPQAPFYRIKEVGAISGLMVQREHRRSGIGRRLLAQARAFFKEQGVRYFTVYTAVANDSAISFYKASGLLPLQTTLVGLIG
jgi:ribosomal protein S18 acetylase RimI-like enzyme